MELYEQFKRMSFDKSLADEFAEETYKEDREAFVTRMEEEGYEVVIPSAGQLQLDIDTVDQLKHFEKAYMVMKDIYGYIPVKGTRSKSGNLHITLDFGDGVFENGIERIAFQACMGSDPVRELLSLARELRDNTPATLFVEDKFSD